MQLSAGLVARGPLASPDGLASIVQTAEQIGLPRVWFGDHVVYPVQYASTYPNSRSGRLGYNPALPQLDVVVAMSWLAAVTEQIGLGVAVMVIAQRQLVALAKQIASLDQLSHGRLTLGIGLGWCREEFQSLGVPFERRGDRTDEYVQALRALWTDETPRYSGEFVSFPPLYCNPKPAQRGGPPIWVGGVGKGALERAARYGAGWVAIGTSPAEIVTKLAFIRQTAADLGRADAERIGAAQWVWRPTRAELVGHLQELRDAGLTEAIVPVWSDDPDEARDFVCSIPKLLDE